MEMNFNEIEEKWKKIWEQKSIYKVSNSSSKPKYYVLDMFPYPSGSGLHVGHPLGYIASDIFSRYKRMQGFEVLHPMGFDSFGLPAEQYAIQRGIHPEKSNNENIKRYRAQLDNIGFSFDWTRQVVTSEPAFYKWTQWIFRNLFLHWYDQQLNKARPIQELVTIFEKEGNGSVQAANSATESFTSAQWKTFSSKKQSDVLMNYRLGYRKEAFVNWCEALGTVLANDEIKDGLSERGGHPVERKPMTQWFLRITAYAERLLNDLDDVDYSDSMKIMQSNWIGRSTGAQVFFEIEAHQEKLEIYTTRADTIFGATFMVLAPEHELVPILTTSDQKKEIDLYLEYVKSRSEVDRMSEVKEVTGAFTGAYALNPFNGHRIPIYIGEYVLKDYGTGAIMAVPADDVRDKAFAKKFNLPILEIIDKSMYPGATIEDKLGKMINSDFLNGMEVLDAINEICNRLEAKGIGTKKINFKMRDANCSRQRYWGEPFPIYYDKAGIPHVVDEKELPLVLPYLDDFKPSQGKAPLAKLTDWVHFGEGYTRETDTMPGFAGSSWYFLRYMDPQNEEEFASKKAIEYWQDVDLYVGGTEHAVGHLLYSRFWHKFLFDLGYTVTKEPYKRLLNQGKIQGISESIYLSKTKQDGLSVFVSKELINESAKSDFISLYVPIQYVQDYGSMKSFLDKKGIEQFIQFVPEYKDALFKTALGTYSAETFNVQAKLFTHGELAKMSKSIYNVINPDEVVAEYGADCFRLFEMFLGPLEQSKPWDTRSIDGVGKFVKRFWASFYNAQDQFSLSDEPATAEELKVLHKAVKKVTEDIERFSFNTCVSQFMILLNELKTLQCTKKEIWDPFVRMLAPFAPFIAEELWFVLGHTDSVHVAEFPKWNEHYLVESTVTYPICVNGKKRGTYDFPSDADQSKLIDQTMQLDFVQKWLEGKSPKKVVVVPGKMVNIVM